MIEEPPDKRCDICGEMHETSEHGEINKADPGLVTNTSKRGGVVSLENFKSRKLKEEAKKSLHALCQSFSEHRFKLNNAVAVLDRLSEKYGYDYESLEGTISDRIIELEVERDILNEKLHSKAQIEEITKKINESKNDLKEWGLAFIDWEEFSGLAYHEQRELYKLMGEDAFRNFLFSIGYEKDFAEDIVLGIKESIKSDSDKLKEEEIEGEWRRIEKEIRDAGEEPE